MNIYIVITIILAAVILLAMSILMVLFVLKKPDNTKVIDTNVVMLYSNGGKGNPYIHEKRYLEQTIKDVNEHYGLYWRIAVKSDITELLKKEISVPYHGHILDYDRPVSVESTNFPRGIKSVESDLSAIYVVGKKITSNDDIYNNMLFIQ